MNIPTTSIDYLKSRITNQSEYISFILDTYSNLYTYVETNYLNITKNRSLTKSNLNIQIINLTELVETIDEYLSLSSARKIIHTPKQFRKAQTKHKIANLALLCKKIKLCLLQVNEMSIPVTYDGSLTLIKHHLLKIRKELFPGWKG